MTLKTFIISSLITFGLSFAIGYWFFAQKDSKTPESEATPQKDSARLVAMATRWA